MKNAAWRGRGAAARSASVTYGYGTTNQVGAMAKTYRAADAAHAGPIATCPVTSGRSGLFFRSISRSAIWLTMFEAAFIAEAHSEPTATVRTTAHVTRRAGSGLCADPKAQIAPETIPTRGGRSVNGRASRT